MLILYIKYIIKIKNYDFMPSYLKNKIKEQEDFIEFLKNSKNSNSIIYDNNFYIISNFKIFSFIFCFVLSFIFFIYFIYYKIIIKKLELNSINNVNLYIILLIAVLFIIIIYLFLILKIQIIVGKNYPYIQFIINSYHKLLIKINNIFYEFIDFLVSFNFIVQLQYMLLVFFIKLQYIFKQKLNKFIIIICLYFLRIIIGITFVLDFFVYNKLYYIVYCLPFLLLILIFKFLFYLIHLFVISQECILYSISILYVGDKTELMDEFDVRLFPQFEYLLNDIEKFKNYLSMYSTFIYPGVYFCNKLYNSYYYHLRIINFIISSLLLVCIFFYY